MASTITASTATVKITETLNLNNKDRGSSTTASIASIGEIIREIKTVLTSGNDLIQFGTKGAGVMSASDVKYIRITNLDDTNYVDINCGDNATLGSIEEMFSIRLTAGQTFMLSGCNFNAMDSGTDTDSAAVDDGELAASATIANVRAVADTASVDVEIFAMAT
jgi:Lhr-like helicase